VSALGPARRKLGLFFSECKVLQGEKSVAKELVCEPKNSKLTFSGGSGAATLELEGGLALAGTSKGKKYSITK
jgi:hypothetical protein